ncbi:MAG: sulfatase-like hydrolase/transferase [Coxiellaceae bacterium]|nr:sulfatase-like hydrolase/transferase [Coxiellaceae bacterium]
MPRRKHSFLYFSLMSLTFMAVVQQAYAYITNKVIFFSYITKAICSGRLHPPAVVWWHLLGFCSAVVLMYFVYTLLIYFVTILAGNRLRLHEKNYLYFGLFIWLLSAFVVLLLNQVFFPASIYSVFISKFFPHWLSVSLLVIFSATLSYFILLAFLQCRRWLKASLVIATGFFSVVIFSNISAGHHYHGATANKPNVIFVGVDALRPDYVTASNMPFLSHFLKGSVNFSQSYTTEARTFASYASILTGLSPKDNGVQINVQDLSKIQVSGSLANILKKHGYVTYYSTDDSRFTNITRQFGFETIDTNGSDLLSYVLCQLNDFPLFNLLANTVVGQYLFPYTYVNRGAHIIYQPHRYVEHVLQSESNIESHPAFLLVHFTLPHWPYTWSDERINPLYTDADMYRAAVQRTDKQLQAYFTGLKQRGFLRHAIVIVLSDHGEALYQKNDRVISTLGYRSGAASNPGIFKRLAFMFKQPDISELSYSFGHGTDLLSFLQTHNVLVWRLFGAEHQPTVNSIRQRVSVLDIKPTLLQLLHLPYSNSAQGFSLAPAFYGHSIPRHPYMLFETGYNPEFMYAPPYTPSKLVNVVANVVSLNPVTGAVIFKEKAYQSILKTKQHATWYKNWYLVEIPQYAKPTTSVLVDLSTGQWTDDLHSSFAKHAPVNTMLRQLSGVF